MAPRILDIASYQHPSGASITWPTVRASNVDGVYVKVTEGQHYINPTWRADVFGARAAGLRAGPYHFARPATNAPASEAEFFVAQLVGVEFDLAPALDLEDGSQLGWRELADWVEEFYLHLPEPLGSSVICVDQDYAHNLPGFPFGKLVWDMTPDAPPLDACWLKRTGIESVPGIAAASDVNELLTDLPGVHSGAPFPAEEPQPTPSPTPNPQPPSERSYEMNLPELSKQEPPDWHDTGTVAAFQAVLNAKGGFHLAVDGKFGPDTDAAVRSYQEAHSLKVDGIIGPVTGTKLLTS